jgi:aminopeptidase N
VQADPVPNRGLEWTQDAVVLVGPAPTPKAIALTIEGVRTPVVTAGSLSSSLVILPTGGGLAYGDVVLDAESRAYLLAHVSDLTDPVSRGSAWVTLWEELLDGRVAPAAFMETALGALPREDVELNVQLVTGYLGDLFWRWLDAGQRAAVAPRLEQVLRRGIARSPSSSLKATYFGAFRRVVTTADGVVWLERVWRRREAITGLTLAETDEAAMAADLALRGVGETEAILTAQLARFENPDRRDRFAFLLPSLSPDQNIRDAFFDTLRELDRRRPESWVVDAMAYLNHPLRRPASERYLRPALALVEEIRRTGDIFFPRNWLDAALGGHSSPEAAALVRAFLDERPEYPARLRQIVLQAADPLFRAAARQPWTDFPGLQ